MYIIDNINIVVNIDFKTRISTRFRERAGSLKKTAQANVDMSKPEQTKGCRTIPAAALVQLKIFHSFTTPD